MADHGNYFVTTLNRTKEREKETKIIYIYNTITTKLLQPHVIISLKEKVFRLYSKYKLEECFSSQISALVKSSTVVKNVIFSFN